MILIWTSYQQVQFGSPLQGWPPILEFFHEIHGPDRLAWAIGALCLTLALTFLLTSVSAAPLGSISSMEVNVDVLEQMDMMDLSDQDTVDVFLACGTEESSVSEPLTGMSPLWSRPGALPASSIFTSFFFSPGHFDLSQCSVYMCTYTHPPYKDSHLVLVTTRLARPHPGLVHATIHLHSPEVKTL